MQDFFPHPQSSVVKSKQSMTLANAPGLREYYNEQDAVAANTARLRALRLAKEAEAADQAVAAKSAKRPAAVKPLVRRGIGNK